MGNPVVQWQIVAKQPEAVPRFYASLFDCKVNTNNALGYAVRQSDILCRS